MMRYLCFSGDGGGAGIDCEFFYPDVILHLPGQGTDGSTTIEDVSDLTHTCTAGGNAQISTTRSKYGTSSIWLDGSAGTYIDVSPGVTTLDLPNDFSIRGWFYVNSSTGADQCFITFGAISGLARDWAWQRLNADSKLNGYNTIDGDYIVSTNTVTTGAWHFLEFGRRLKTYYLFIDGAQEATYTPAAVVTVIGDSLRIGAWLDGSERLDAYIEDFQIIRGYMVGGAVPDQPLPTEVCPEIDFTWSLTRRSYAWSLSGSASVATLDVEVTAQVVGTLPKSSGKWYFEVEIGGTPNTSFPHSPGIGVCGVNDGNPNMIDLVGGGTNQWGYLRSALKRHNGSAVSFGATFTAGDTIGVAVDFTAGKIWFSKNGTWQGASADPAAGTGEAYSSVSGTLVPHMAANIGAPVGTLKKTSTNTPSGFTYWAG